MQEAQYLFPFYAVLGNLFLGGFVLFKDYRNKINISYAATACLIALWTVFIFLYDISNTPYEALVWSKIATSLFAFLPIPFLYFFSVFPHEDAVPRQYQLVAWVCVSFFFSLLSFSDLIIRFTSIQHGKFVFIPGLAYVLFVFYFIGFIVFAFQRLMERFNSYSGLDKRQITYVFWGFLLGFSLPVITNLICPLFGYTALAGYGPFSTIITVGFISYAITKTRLMDISVIVTRTIAEIFAILFHAIVFLAFILLYHHFVSNNIDWLFISIITSFAIIMGFTLQILRIFFQTSSDKLFLHGKYDYYKSLSEASSHVVEKLVFSDILSVLYHTFHEVVEISNPRVYLPENFTETEKLSKSYVFYDKITFAPKTGGQAIAIDNPLIANLINKREPIHEIKALQAALVVPCLLENRLIAIFVLGPKLSVDAYTDDDVRLLQTLANQAAIALDHTRSYEKIKNDLEAAEHHLARSQRLASIGTLTAGVTHEIRNPLTAIRAETERLTTHPRDMEFIKNYQELVLRNIARVEGIVERMLGLARRKEKQNLPVNINDQIEAVIPLIPAYNVTITKELSPLPSIQGDPEQIQEVFINIIQNAIQAMPAGGQLTIKTHADKASVIVEIEDNGLGIQPEIQEKIFDPFFSTRHEGTGLGLSIAYRIIREHGGDIKVTSQVGKGTTFEITF